MNTEDYINKYKYGKVIEPLKYKRVSKNYIVAGMPIVKCRDAILINKRYKGIRISDINIFDPNYITYIKNSKYTPEELKEIIDDVERNQRLDDIKREMILG